MRTASGLFLGLGACLASLALGEKQDSHHAMDFLKMVEAQAMEWEDRKLQLIGNTGGGMGALVGAINTVSQANTPTAFGSGGLLSNNLLNGNNLLGGGGTTATGGDKGLINMPTFGASVDTTVTPAGKPFVPTLGDGGNAIGAATVGAAMKSASAPETCGAPLSISVESLTEYRVFVDGNQVGYSNGVQQQRYETTYGSSGAVTVAIEATRDNDMPNFASVDGLAVNITVCGQTFISDQDWVCTDTRPWTTSWRLGSYTPFQWMQAALVRDAARLIDGSTSFAIWSKPGCDSKGGVPEQAFCRLTLKPTTPCAKFVPCYAEQVTSAPDTTCLMGCVMETATKDKCATIAHQLASGCGACTPAYMTYYRQYCKTQGCSAEQCQMPREPTFTPNSACLSSCDANSFRSQCEQQAHQFQSGCSSSCGPETLAFARDQCLASYKCSPTQCSTFADTGAVNGGLANGGGGSEGGVAPAPAPGGAPGYTPPPTPDLTCFFRCLGGMNRLENYCDKINFALTANCHNCPDNIIQWARTSCVDYEDPDGNKCTAEQCAVNK